MPQVLAIVAGYLRRLDFHDSDVNWVICTSCGVKYSIDELVYFFYWVARGMVCKFVDKVSKLPNVLWSSIRHLQIKKHLRWIIMNFIPIIILNYWLICKITKLHNFICWVKENICWEDISMWNFWSVQIIEGWKNWFEDLQQYWLLDEALVVYRFNYQLLHFRKVDQLHGYAQIAFDFIIKTFFVSY